MFKNLMIDIETLSKKHNASIISIAAIPFNDDFEISKNIFHCNISLQSCLDNNFVIDENTLEWWLDTNPTLLKQILSLDTIHITAMLINLSQFINDNMHDDFTIWAKGSTFDLAKLTYAYEYFNIYRPWHYRNERCIRTKLHNKNEYSMNVNVNVEEIRKFLSLDNNQILDFHSPIVDCYYQIKLLQALDEQSK